MTREGEELNKLKSNVRKRIEELREKIMNSSTMEITRSDFIKDSRKFKISISCCKPKIKLVKLTEVGKEAISNWILLDKNREINCPFFGTCAVCEEVFIYYRRAMVKNAQTFKSKARATKTCPCFLLGEDACIDAGKELLNHNTSIFNKITKKVREIISNW